MSESEFSWLPDDLVLNIFYKLENNPRSWARLACVSTRFSSLIRNVCCKSKCSQTIPSVVNDLLSASSAVPPGGWAALCNLAVCCPGLRQAGVVLDGASESSKHRPEVVVEEPRRPARELSVCKRRKFCTSLMPHLNLGVWNLSREQGNKLLASRFKWDCLYVCDWPGCVHIEDKQNYMLFRGIFKNFKESGVWRTINDGQKKSRIDLNCAFCSCKQTWDLLSAFCLRRCFGYHDDGEPVVRAYVCENGHVSGAWTDWLLYVDFH
ncbi:hypothetical protein ACH5RR_010785 [Cinchona calisaya]|uniref:F-box domain-containing protein n=1 Tax=Cinchona calisaya TaxID=153742 RepID=A0ABD3AJW3_9GENT